MTSNQLFFQDLLNESKDLYQPWLIKTLPLAPIKVPTIVATIQSNTNITALVLDEFGGPLPYANIAINGVPTAQTNTAGVFFINSISPLATIKVSYVGLADATFIASSLPSRINMKTTAIQLEGVVITIPKKPITTTPITSKEPTNWLLWLSLGMAGILVYKKFATGAVVKAKI